MVRVVIGHDLVLQQGTQFCLDLRVAALQGRSETAIAQFWHPHCSVLVAGPIIHRLHTYGMNIYDTNILVRCTYDVNILYGYMICTYVSNIPFWSHMWLGTQLWTRRRRYHTETCRWTCGPARPLLYSQKFSTSSRIFSWSWTWVVSGSSWELGGWSYYMCIRYVHFICSFHMCIPYVHLMDLVCHHNNMENN